MSDFKTVNSIPDTAKRKRENKALPLVYSSVLANRFSHISTLYRASDPPFFTKLPRGFRF